MILQLIIMNIANKLYQRGTRLITVYHHHVLIKAAGCKVLELHPHWKKKNAQAACRRTFCAFFLINLICQVLQYTFNENSQSCTPKHIFHTKKW